MTVLRDDGIARCGHKQDEGTTYTKTKAEINVSLVYMVVKEKESDVELFLESDDVFAVSKAVSQSAWKS